MYATSRTLKESESLDLDKEYSPSLNSKRFQEHTQPADKVIEHFIEVTERDTQSLRSKYKIRENIRYGKVQDDDNQVVDIYYLKQEKDSPIFVYIHGGYWQALDKSTAGSFVAPLVDRGHRVVVMDYNLCPKVTLEKLINQTFDFFGWVFKYADETNASSITFCGHSAGAHLATHLLKFSPSPYITKIKAFFLISGLYDLRELWNLESANAANILSLDLETATSLSPMCWDLGCRNDDMPVYILVAENDSTTFKEQSRQYAEKLKILGVATEFKMFLNYDHFDIIEEASVERSDICSYVLEKLR